MKGLGIGHTVTSQIEKIVLAVVVVICLWLFFTRVLFSPNTVSIGGRNLAPGQIDEYVGQKAQELQEKLRQEDKADAIGYTSRLDGRIEANDPVIAGVINQPLPKGFKGLFGDPIGFVDIAPAPSASLQASARRPASQRQATPAVPRSVEATAQVEPQAPLPAAVKRPVGPRYKLPQIPELTDVTAGHVRAAAYVPVEKVTPQTPYARVQVEPNDIDLVTVEARFDVGELYDRFRQHFAGSEVEQEQWRDPCLAEPVFAAVQLQRQESLGDGNWSDWLDVPRTRIEANRDLFQIIERVPDLPAGGMELRVAQFKPREIVTALLQPEAYRIASADEEWFPPSYHDIYWDLQRKAGLEERREERQQQRQAVADARRDEASPDGLYGGVRRTPQAGSRGRTRDTTLYGPTGRRSTGTPQVRGGRTRTGRRSTPEDAMYADPEAMNQAEKRRPSAPQDVYLDFAEELIGNHLDLSEREEGLLIWAIDDTVEAGKTYQYRIRIGVFNPVAGTDRVAERDADKKDRVILWSDFSGPTEPVRIPGMLYLFAKSVQGQTKTVTMEVSRYWLGYWRTESFQVRPGDAIGKKMELKEQEDPVRSRPVASRGRIASPRGGLVEDPLYQPMTPDAANTPVIVDFRTGKRLVDLVEVQSPAQPYYEALCSSGGTDIERIPVGPSHWPGEAMGAYRYVQSEKRRTPKPLRAFNRAAYGPADPYAARGKIDLTR